MSKDNDIWGDYAKSVKPMKPVPRKVATAKPAPVAHNIRQAAEKHPITFIAASTKPVTDWDAPLGRTPERDLRSGDTELDGRIDLHGMTQDEAYKALAKFIPAQLKRGARTLLIITGRGSVMQGGVIRSNLRAWLEALPQANTILRLCPAAAKHGGAGAYYLVLKKNRV